MGDRNKHIPQSRRGTGPFLVSGKTLELWDAIAARPQIELDPSMFDYTERDGKRIYRLKKTTPPAEGGRKGGFDRFGVWVDVARQQLMVDPGTIIYGGGGNYLTIPVFPTLDDITLDSVDDDGWGPSFPLAGKNAGTTYSVVIFYRAGVCGSDIDLEDDEANDSLDADEDINTIQMLSPGELEGLEWKPGKGVSLVAEVELREGELGLEKEKIVQFLGSDFWPKCEEPIESGSSGGDGDSDDDDISGGSGSSGGEDPDPDPDESSTDPEPSDRCCPGITYFDAIVASVGATVEGFENAGCFTNEIDSEPMVVSVGGYVGLLNLADPECEKCAGRFDVVYGIGSQSYRERIGIGGHNFGHDFVIAGYACASYTYWARVERFGVPISSNGCEQLFNCDVEKTIKAPPVCGETCSDDSSEEPDSTIVEPPTEIPPP